MSLLRSVVLANVLIASCGLAIWTPFGQPMPLDRVLENVQTQLRTSPNDASAWLVLARLHSFAFFTGSQQVPMRNGQIFMSNLPHPPQPPEASAGSFAHLKESIVAFRKSIALDSKVAMAYLGLGWDLEQGAKFAAKIGAVPGEDGPATPSHWIDRALEMYRQAYSLAAKRELTMIGFMPGYEAISQEAATRIVAIQQERLKESKQDLPEVRTEIARMEESLTKLRHVPRAVTPIIFSFHEGTPLRELLAPDVHVTFDLDGFGSSVWTWLQPSTGILVWDPGHTGSIQSGLQLFGSVTWWMFWRDGFQALAALDDNHDGWLSGKELAGLAVWMDHNQNGKSDAGEVIPLADAGIVRIGVSASADASGMLTNPRGIEFIDERLTPSYDWIAQTH